MHCGKSVGYGDVEGVSIRASCASALTRPVLAAASMIEGYSDIVICRTDETATIGYLHRDLGDQAAV